ncbi:MAG: hypothetical protein NTZ13_01680 [Candidatus Parcubacteria bacterium]|nr:hypothetical protein [Candidatus Parcubacteria bacterium]
MSHKLYSFFLLVLIATMAVLNFYAYKFHWYWEFWWFDMIMHTLGGIWVASFALWFRYLRPLLKEMVVPKKTSIFLIAFISILLVGGGWELFEFSLDKLITFALHDSWNTVSDLFFDLSGGTLAVFLFFSVYNINSKIEK